MPTDFTLPELGENVTAGDVVRVLVAVGDTVAKDQAILELETDDRSGTYVVTRFGDEKIAPESPEKRRRRRRRRGGSGRTGRPRPAEETAANGAEAPPPESTQPAAFDEEFIAWPDDE